MPDVLVFVHILVFAVHEGFQEFYALSWFHTIEPGKSQTATRPFAVLRHNANPCDALVRRTKQNRHRTWRFELSGGVIVAARGYVFAIVPLFEPAAAAVVWQGAVVIAAAHHAVFTDLRNGIAEPLGIGRL